MLFLLDEVRAKYFLWKRLHCQPAAVLNQKENTTTATTKMRCWKKKYKKKAIRFDETFFCAYLYVQHRTPARVKESKQNSSVDRCRLPRRLDNKIVSILPYRSFRMEKKEVRTRIHRHPQHQSVYKMACCNANFGANMRFIYEKHSAFFKSSFPLMMFGCRAFYIFLFI